MPAPVILALQSRLGFRQWEEAAFQPYATNNPTGWAASNLPPGWVIDETTGMISGTATMPGFYAFALTASNADGLSVPRIFTAGIDAVGYLSPDASISLVWDEVSGIVTLDSGQSEGSPADPRELDEEKLKAAQPLFWLTNNDVRVLNIKRLKGNVTIGTRLRTLKFTLKAEEPSDKIAQFANFTRLGIGSATMHRLVGAMTGDTIAAALSDEEEDFGTQRLVLAELEATEPNNVVVGAFTTAFADDLFTLNAHGLPNGAEVHVASADALPDGLTAAASYYVRDAALNTFKLSLTEGGAPVELADDGTGTHTLYLGPAFLRSTSRNFLVGIKRELTANT